MTQHFRRKDESVEAGFRRIAVEEIEAAIAIIDGDRPLEDKVHKVRRQMKALRSLLRLVRPAFARYRKENRGFRDMGLRLSAMRDAKVMLDTFDVITRRPDGRPPSRGFQAVRDRLAAACAVHADMQALLAGVRGDLIQARKRAESWSLSDKGWDALSKGLKQTYGRARRAMRHALASGDAQASHEWRKGVKYLGGQARLLKRMNPKALKADEKAASRLGDLLGERHDIDVFLDLLAHAPARFGDIVTLTQIAALARLRLARLDRQAERVGEVLFARKPGKLVDQWRGWWKDWRGGDD